MLANVVLMLFVQMELVNLDVTMINIAILNKLVFMELVKVLVLLLMSVAEKLYVLSATILQFANVQMVIGATQIVCVLVLLQNAH